MLVRSRFNIFVRATAFIMLIAMFHYVAGYRLMYSLGILLAKEQAKESMVEKKSSTQKIVLSTADYNALNWTEDNKEFSYNNEMYDVNNIQKSGDNYILTVYSDDKETGWVSSLHNFEKEIFHPDQSGKGAKSAENVMSSFQKDFTTLSVFKVNIYTVSGLIQPVVADKKQPLQATNNIWHPPTC